MKKSIVISMALFAFAFGANASVVTLERATKVARTWLVNQGKAASPAAVSIQRTSVLNLPGLGADARYFAVKFKHAGTVITSSDDTASPVVVFSDSEEDLNASDEKSPLYALLCRDFQIRRDARSAAVEFSRRPQISNEYRFYLDHQRLLDYNRAEWSRLSDDVMLAKEGAIAWYGSDDWFIRTYTANTLYDIRVAPFVESRWSQSSVGGQACYNYYTPNEKDPFDVFGYAGRADNAVCGCVATAIAQTLRYFALDYEVTETNTAFGCTYTYVTGVKTNITRRLQGGRYNWNKMTLVPELGLRDGSFSATNAMEIGKLCADCGAAVNMMYSQSASGAYSSAVPGVFTDIFGFRSVRMFSSSGDIGSPYGKDSPIIEPSKFPESRTNTLQRVFYSNFDAGLPLVVGLTGHEVVADGYGYSKDGLDYVHINMGWGGQCDLWYLLPNVSCDSRGRPEGNLMFFEDCVYNIFATNTASQVVMSGRVIDDDYAPIADARVKICRPGDYDHPVAEFVTGENGIWGLIVSPGVYEVVASDDIATESETFSVFGDNRWGCDIMLAPPAVRNLMQSAPTNEYTSLDKAIRAANTNDILEVFAVTRLKKSVVIDRDLTIRTVGAYADDPTNCLIRCNNASSITVAPGVRAEFRALAFRSDAETVINVAAEGVAAFAGRLGVGTIRTADTNGFELVGAIDFADGYSLMLDCAQASELGQRIGRWTCSAAEKDSVNRLLNPGNLDLGGIANDDRTVTWGVVPVDPRNAVAYLADGSGVYYRTLDNLFRANPEGDLDIRITKDSEGLNIPVDVTGRNISISSDGGPFKISGVGPKTGFLVGAGGELTFENVTVDGFEGEWFVRIPENGGVFTLGAGAKLLNLHAAGDLDVGEFPNGLISMLGGRMKTEPGSVISGCSYQNGLGGVIVLYGGTLDIEGCSITGCSAEQGGVVYYHPYFEGSALNISGEVDICGNTVNGGTSADDRVPGDIYLADRSALVTVTGDVTSDLGVGVWRGQNDISNVFGVVTGTLSDPGVFFYDRNGGLATPLAAVRDGADLMWDFATETFGQCDPADATVLVTYTESGELLYYDNLATAFNNLHGDASVVLTADQRLVADAAVDYAIAVDGAGHSVVREAPCSIIVGPEGDLTLNDITITGYDVERPWYYYVIGGYMLFADFRGSNRRIIEVDGGRLTLGSGTEICRLGADQVLDRLLDESDPQLLELLMSYSELYWYGVNAIDLYDRASCAVVAWNGAELVMEDGAEIHDCWNLYFEDPVNCGSTAGILVENSTAYLRGGTIRDCIASIGSAVNVCQGVDQQSEVYLGGGVVMTGNVDINGEDSNFALEDLSRLYLESEFTGGLGFTPGYFADTNRVTEVITNLTETQVSASAARFRNDDTGAIGVGVVSAAGDGYLVVWSTALDADGRFYEVNSDGTTNVWIAIGDIPDPPDPPDPPGPTYVVVTNVPTAMAFSSIVRADDEQTCTVTITNLVKGANYSLFKVVSIDGGFDIGTAVPFTNFNAAADGPFTVTVPAPTPALFWKASGRTTYVTNYLSSTSL